MRTQDLILRYLSSDMIRFNDLFVFYLIKRAPAICLAPRSRGDAYNLSRVLDYRIKLYFAIEYVPSVITQFYDQRQILQHYLLTSGPAHN